MARLAFKTTLLALFTGAIFALSILAQDRTQLPVLVAIALGGSGLLAWFWYRVHFLLRDVLIYAVVFRLALVWLSPSLSDDAFRYIWDGLVLAEGVNPYEFTPEDDVLAVLQGEAVYEVLNSKAFYSVYPPVSQYVFALGSLFYDHGWIASHFAIKGILVLAELIALFLLARLVTARSLMLYAWNPLVLIETAGQGHPESLLLLLLILVIWASRARKGTWACIALAAASWVKLFPLVLFPFLWRRFGWRTVWPSLVALTFLALPFAAAYVPGNVMESLDLYARYFEFNAGLYYGIKEIYFSFTGMDYSKQIGPALRWCFLVGLPLLYVLDWRRRWSLAKAFLVCTGLYLVLSTTVHPWYFLTPLFLMALLDRPVWAWYWVGALSIGTYLLYASGPYWEVVIAGWGGAIVLALIQYRSRIVQSLLRTRAKQKVKFIQPYLPRLRKPLRFLDLGCGEGYVGERIQQLLSADVMLADIVDMNKAALQHTKYSSGQLPWDNNTFDVVVVYFVLHHAEDPVSVLEEARRVARHRIIVVESVYEGRLSLRLLTVLDKVANRVRNWRIMADQEEHLAFRTAKGWRTVFSEVGLSILAEQARGRFPHIQHLFVLDTR